MFGSLLHSETTQTHSVTSPYGKRMSFTFRYSYVGSSWRAYIVSSPSYGIRSNDWHSTHRYYDDGKGMYYVCWTENLARLDHMVEVSKLWAKKTAEYIDTGRKF